MFNFGANKRSQIVVIVLGARTTNAIHLEKSERGFNFLNYTLQPTPARVPGLSHGILVEHFKRVYQALEAQTRRVIMVIGMGDSILRHAELPALPVSDLRGLIQNNSKNLLQQDLSEYRIDCHLLSAPGEPRPAEPAKPSTKRRVLIGGARRGLVSDLRAALDEAGLITEQITLSQVGLVNAAWLAMPDVIRAGVVALVDIGFASSTISFLVKGEVMLSRVVGIGAESFTHGLAEAMSISQQAAEGAILVMTDKVRTQLQSLLAPLQQELRASIDFFEDEQSKHVERVLVSGGSARSEFIVEALATGLGRPVSKWDPTSTLNLKLPPQRLEEVAKDAPQLAVAIGAAMAYFDRHLLHLDFLAEESEQQIRRRRDPVRWASAAAAALVLAMLAWGGSMWLSLHRAEESLANANQALYGLQKKAMAVVVLSKKISELERVLRLLHKHATNRFLWAESLAELPATLVTNIQVMQIRMDESFTLVPGTKEVRNGEKVTPAKPATITQRPVLTLQAKDTGDPPAAYAFIQALNDSDWVKRSLRKNDPIRLKERGAEQLDPANPRQTFILLAIECYFPDRVTTDE